MADTTNIHIGFVDGAQYPNVPSVEKVEVRGHKRVVVKRTVNGTTEVTDFDFSGFSKSGYMSRPFSDTVYRVNVNANGITEFALVASGDNPRINGSFQTYPAYPYLANDETQTQETLTETPTWLPTAEASSAAKTRIRSEAVSHARTCFDVMVSGWIVDNTGAFATIRNKWRNTRLWILSGLAVIDAILDSTESAWGEDVAQNALDAYRSLIPADRSNIETWYFAHTEAIWNVYFTENSGNVPAYFNWRRGDTSPAFASDAASSVLWDGNNNTLDVDFAADATPEDFSA